MAGTKWMVSVCGEVTAVGAGVGRLIFALAEKKAQT
jgi:hypothetical protein